MKQLIIIILFLLQGSWLFAQKEKSYIHKGNELYKEKKYKEAEESYRKSVGQGTDNQQAPNVTGSFNLGDALFKQKKFAEAGEQFNQLAGTSASNKAIAAAAYHNMGNSLLENKKLEESIDAYKKSLLNNPNDDETRYNLAYAQEMLKKQNQQNKQNKNDKNQDKKNQQNKDNKNQDKNNPDKNNQDKQNQDKNNQDKKDQQNGQQPNNLSKDDAQRMLDALNNNEKQTQDKLKNKKLKGAKMHVTKDW